MRYNGVLGPNGAAAIRNNNLAELWYEVRYNSNNGSSRHSAGFGLGRRRILESNNIDWLSNTDGKTVEERYKDAYIMYQNHKDSIHKYENDISETGNFNKGTPVTIKDLFTNSSNDPYYTDCGPNNSFSHQVEPARDYLVKTYGLGKEIAWDAVIVGKDNGSIYKTGTAYTKSDGKDTINLSTIKKFDKTNFKAGETTLTLGGSGNDTITGADSDDIIYGEDGNDTIDGSAGNDIIFSGNGEDTIDGGEGNDIIDLTSIQIQHTDFGEDINIPYNKNIKFGFNSGIDTIYCINSNNIKIMLEGVSTNDISWQKDRLIVSKENNTNNDSIMNLYRTNNITLSIGDTEYNLNDFHNSGYISLEDYVNSSNPFTNNSGNIMDGFYTNFYDINESIRDWNKKNNPNKKLQNPNASDKDDVLYGDYHKDYKDSPLEIENTINGLKGNDKIYGGNGGDTINGGEGNDLIYGDDGEDILNGGNDNDTIFGGSGSDTIRGDDGNDNIVSGDAYYQDDYEKDIVYGGKGHDRINGDINDELYGDSGNDIITLSGIGKAFGGDGHDYVKGYGELHGNDGHDVIIGSGELFGDAGDDILEASRTHEKIKENVLDGGTGNDTLKGFSKKDIFVFNTGYGHDVIEGFAGNTLTISGISAPDVKDYNKFFVNNDTLKIIIDNNNSLTIENFCAGKSIIFSNKTIKYEDIAYVGSNVSDTISSSSKVTYGKGGNDEITGYGTIYGNEGNDKIAGSGTIYGNEGNDKITGSGTIYGNEGNDTLTSTTSEAGATIDGGVGDDKLKGVNSSDTFVFKSNYGHDVITAFSGDVVNINGYTPSESFIKNKDNFFIKDGNLNIIINPNNSLVINNFIRGKSISFNDGTAISYESINFVGDNNNNIINEEDDEKNIYGLNGNDTITGSGHLYGGPGVDHLLAGNNNTTLDGGADNSTLFVKNYKSSKDYKKSKDGIIKGLSADNLKILNDALNEITLVSYNESNYFTIVDLNTTTSLYGMFVSSGTSVYGTENHDSITSYCDGITLYGYEGSDRISGNNSTLNGGVGDDNLSGNGSILNGGAGDDTLEGYDSTLNGGAGDDIIKSWMGNNIIHGGEGNDTISGGKDNDVLCGDAGDDTINDNEGDDIIDGGVGDDILQGGKGDDTYIFGFGYGNDEIANEGQFDIDGYDTIKLAADVKRTDLTITKENEYIILTLSDGSTLKIKCYSFGLFPIEKIEFLNGMDSNIYFNPSYDDDYKFGLGFPNNEITEHNGSDTLQIMSDIKLSDISFKRINKDLQLQLSDGSSFVIKNYFENNYYKIENLKMFNGEVLNLFDIVKDLPINGTSGNDINNSIGDDSNVYNFGFNCGNDIIYDDTEFNIIKLSSEVRSTDLTITRDSENVILNLSDGSSLTFKNGYKFNGPISEIVFLNGIDATINLKDIIKDIPIIGTDSDDYLYAPNNIEMSIYGGKGNDTIYSSPYNNTKMYGEDGDDILWGQKYTDTLFDGGRGNDTLNSGGGNNTYIFGYDYGFDVIQGGSDEGYSSIIRIKSDVTANDLQITNNGTDVIITLSDGSMMTISGGFLNSSNVQKIVFENGVDADILISDYVANNGRNPEFIGVDGTDGDDILSISNTQMTAMFGHDGNDELFGGDFDDYFDGGSGNDIIYGYKGNDNYRFGFGMGEDTIYDNGDYADTDVIRMDADINASDVTISNINNDIIVSLSDGSKITIKDGATNPIIERISFSNGVDNEIMLFDNTDNTGGNGDNGGNNGGGNTGGDMPNLEPTIIGTDDGDDLDGTSGDDIIDGKEGCDDIHGKSGSDTYIFGFGYDEDRIYDFNSGNDKNIIRLNSEVHAYDVTLTRSDNDIYLYLSDGSKLILQDGYSNISSYDRIVFSNGTDNDIIFSEIKDTITKEKSVIFGTNDNDVLEADPLYNTEIQGMKGNDIINGGIHNDELYGGDGDDIITGGKGDDSLSGSSGNDILDGGTGNDTLRGSRGSDTYIFGFGYGEDYMSDSSTDPNDINIVKMKGEIRASDLTFTKDKKIFI